MTALPVVLGIFTGFCLYMLIRNTGVYNYRTKVLDALHETNQRDIKDGKYAKCDQRWDEYRSVSYNQMMFTFWKPVSKFYDPEFLKEIGVE